MCRENGDNAFLKVRFIRNTSIKIFIYIYIYFYCVLCEPHFMKHRIALEAKGNQIDTI